MKHDMAAMKTLGEASVETAPNFLESNDVYFVGSEMLTLGVEVEFQLIDQDSLRLVSKAAEVLDKLPNHSYIKPEFHKHSVEINTGICRSVSQATQDLLHVTKELRRATSACNLALSTTGVHPFSKYEDCEIYPFYRYFDLVDRKQWLSRRLTVCGLHVHLGMENGNQCIRYNNFFLHFIPHFLAITASSPFWQGADTGLACCRPTAYEALPTAGQPYPVRDWVEFEHLYASLKRCDSVRSIKDLWWDLRPSPGYGTLEIRVCDGCATFDEIMATVAFIHALAYWFADNDATEYDDFPRQWILRENKWRAIRYGMDADLVMNASGATKLLKRDMLNWLDILGPIADKLGYMPYFSILRACVEKGGSYERQRSVFRKRSSTLDVVKHNIAEFYAGSPIW